MAQIPLSGLPSTFRVPGGYVQLRVAQGPSSASAGERDVCLVMPKLAASGAWSANTEYRIRSEQDAIDGAGEGSFLHIAAREFLRHNKNSKLYAVPYLPSSATSLETADLDLEVTFASGSNPTAAGIGAVYIGGEACSFSYSTVDTATTIGDSIEAAINARTWLPVSASNTSGTVTITCKTAGIAGGDGTRPVVRVRMEFSPSTNVTLQSENSLTSDFLGNSSGQAGVDGSTTEASNLNTALSSLDVTRRYYVVTSTYLSDGSDEGWDYVNSHVVTKSAPKQGLRSIGVAAAVHTLADVTGDVNSLNSERFRVAWQKNSDKHPAQIAAAYAAILQAGESLDAAYNFDGFRGGRQDITNGWFIPAAADNGDWPDTDDVNDAINDGITVIQSDDLGSYIVMSCCTRSKDAGGTVDDFRATETHRVSAADFVLDTLLLRFRLDFANFKLAPDQLLADGVTVDPRQRIASRTTTPSTFKPWMIRQLNTFGPAGRGLLVRLTDTESGLDVLLDPDNSGRLEVGFPMYVVNLLHQATIRADEATEG